MLSKQFPLHLCFWNLNSISGRTGVKFYDNINFFQFPINFTNLFFVTPKLVSSHEKKNPSDFLDKLWNEKFIDAQCLEGRDI